MRALLLVLRLIRAAAWTSAVIIVALSLVPPGLRPESGLSSHLEHFMAFALSGIAFGLSYDARRGLLMIQLVIFAACIEVAQLFVPGRHARLSDLLIDTIAIAFGSVIGSWTKRIYPALKT